MFIRAGVILKEAIKKKGLQQGLEAVQILEEFSKIAEKLWSKRIAENIKPISFKNGELAVSVISSVLGQELKLKEYAILKEMNALFVNQQVKRLRIIS